MAAALFAGGAVVSLAAVVPLDEGVPPTTGIGLVVRGELVSACESTAAEAVPSLATGAKSGPVLGVLDAS